MAVRTELSVAQLAELPLLTNIYGFQMEKYVIVKVDESYHFPKPFQTLLASKVRVLGSHTKYETVAFENNGIVVVGTRLEKHAKKKEAEKRCNEYNPKRRISTQPINHANDEFVVLKFMEIVTHGTDKVFFACKKKSEIQNNYCYYRNQHCRVEILYSVDNLRRGQREAQRLNFEKLAAIEQVNDSPFLTVQEQESQQEQVPQQLEQQDVQPVVVQPEVQWPVLAVNGSLRVEVVQPNPDLDDVPFDPADFQEQDSDSDIDVQEVEVVTLD